MGLTQRRDEWDLPGCVENAKSLERSSSPVAAWKRLEDWRRPVPSTHTSLVHELVLTLHRPSLIAQYAISRTCSFKLSANLQDSLGNSLQPIMK